VTFGKEMRPQKKEKSPRRTVGFVSAACLILGLLLLFLGLGLLPGYLRMQQWLHQPKLLSAVSVDSVVATVGWGLLLVGLLSLLYSIFAVMLWKARKKIAD
jgi:hypothetical protein